MKKIFILLVVAISIVYCESCVVTQPSVKDKNVNQAFYHSDVPAWLLRSI